MSLVVIEDLSDDLDPRIKNGVETVSFQIDGNLYEIELGEQNRKHLENALNKVRETYVSKARLIEDVKPVKATKTAAKSDVDKVRVWARANGYTVGDRGRIKADILAAYASAQEAIANPDTDAQASGDVPVAVVVESDQAEVDNLLDEATGNVDVEPVSESDVLDMLAKMDADGQELTEENLKAALASE